MERRIKDYAVLTLKGMAMGAADVVPGVSGGTIAFIAGIYDELINSIKSIVTKDIKGWNWKTVAGFVGGAVIAYYITVATPAETSTNLMFIFLCGAIAICAMILPGISGSFILVLLGKYFYVMEAVKTLDLVVLGVFAFGAALGITSFSRVLSYALKNFRNITLSVLSGFMLGSLNKVWPWKEVEKLVSDGHEVMIEHNIAPNTEVAEAVVLMLIGFILVYVLEKISAKKA